MTTVHEIPGVLSAEQCEQLIAEHGSRVQRSMTGGALRRRVSPARTSWSAKLEDAELPVDVVEAVRGKIAAATALPRSHQERLELVRYRVGEEYRAHHDGARAYSAVVCLRPADAGGETTFPKLQRLFRPPVGALLLWDNLRASGAPDPTALHASWPVRSGEKWVLVTWVLAAPHH